MFKKKEKGRVKVKKGKRGFWWWQLFAGDELVAIAPINHKHRSAALALKAAQRVAEMDWRINDEYCYKLSKAVDPDHNK